MESMKAKLLQKQRVEWWLPGTEKWGKWGDVDQRAQLSFKVSMFQASNVQYYYNN